jgi:integrase
MPLKVEKRPDTGSLWIVGTVRPAGEVKGIRVRRRAGSDDPDLAREEAAALEAQLLRNVWHGEKPISRGFSAAALSYLKHEARSEGTKALVRRLTLHFRDTSVDKIGQEAVDRARGALLRPDATAGTVRRNLIVPLRAILLHAAKRKWCSAPSFDVPAEGKGRITFLLPEQVQALVTAASPHLRPMLLFMVCTGCRLGEVLRLEWTEVDLLGARVLLWEGETKSGSRRVVSLTPAAVAALASIEGQAGEVFRNRHGDPYRQTAKGGGGQIRKAWANACRRAGLPGEAAVKERPDRTSRVTTFAPVFMPHHLRHTWATWHYALRRDLLLLKTEGGWATTLLAERYAHLMPAGHEENIRSVGASKVKDTRPPTVSGKSRSWPDF